jgi:hypothetical protein
MSTLLPDVLCKQIDDEIREMITVRPHNVEATVSPRLDAQLIALLLLSAHQTPNCNVEFAVWTENGPLASLEKEERQKFAKGMLAAARGDVIRFLSERMSIDIDLDNADITEAAALQLVVLIMGNMVMRSLQLKHDAENREVRDGKTV